MADAQHSNHILANGAVDTTMPDAVDGVTSCAATPNLQYYLLQAVRRLRWQRMSRFRLRLQFHEELRAALPDVDPGTL